MSETRKRYHGSFIRYASSYDGKEVFEVTIHRKNQRNTSEYLNIEIELSRSSLNCVIRAMKAFADKEREQITQMPI